MDGPRGRTAAPAPRISDRSLDRRELERAPGRFTIRTQGTLERAVAKHFGG